MDSYVVYLVGWSATFIIIMTGFMILAFCEYGDSWDVKFLDVLVIVCFCGALSTFWFVTIPILVLSYVSLLLTKLIIKLFDLGGTSE